MKGILKMTKSSLSFLEIYDYLENNLICGIESNFNNDLITIFNNLYKKNFINISQLLHFIWFDIGNFKPTKDINGYKIGCLKDENKARKKLDSFLLSFIDL